MPLIPAHSDQDQRFARAWQLLEHGIAAQIAPGAAVALTVGDKLVAHRGVGRFTYDANSPAVKAGTIYDLASVSKVIATTAMAMLLYERGVLDLDAPVAAVLPDFAQGDSRKRDVTFIHLLAHSSGLPAYEELYERCSTRDELVRACFHMDLEAEPGERAEYSDIGFIILVEALALMADEPLDTFCHREVFGPLGMAQTGFHPPRETRPKIPPTADDRDFRKKIVQGEVHDENAWVMGGVAGHAGVFAPTLDVARFAHCMLHGGAPILRPETVSLFTGRASEPRGTSRALGWDTPSSPSQSGRHFSAHSYGHLGYTGTSLWIDPERQLSVTLLTNRTWPDRHDDTIKKLRPQFHDALLEAL